MIHLVGERLPANGSQAAGYKRRVYDDVHFHPSRRLILFRVWNRLKLIDGARLTGLMIEHGVGVSHRVVKVPKVDGDHFVE